MVHRALHKRIFLLWMCHLLLSPSLTSPSALVPCFFLNTWRGKKSSCLRNFFLCWKNTLQVLFPYLSKVLLKKSYLFSGALFLIVTHLHWCFLCYSTHNLSLSGSWSVIFTVFSPFTYLNLVIPKIEDFNICFLSVLSSAPRTVWLW